MLTQQFTTRPAGGDRAHAAYRGRRRRRVMRSGAAVIVRGVGLLLIGYLTLYIVWTLHRKPVGSMSEQTLDYFLRRREIKSRDAAEVRWSHAVNSRSRLTEALRGPTHMIEADVILGRDPREPIMAHPPDTNSDITLKEWLEDVKTHDKGIKLDFKSLEAVSPSVALLEEVLSSELSRPVWINADILSGPGGQATPLEPVAFLLTLNNLPAHTVLSLGWTSGWTNGTDNPGYSWDMVHGMEDLCKTLQHPVNFPVRAALLGQSLPQLTWLLQQSNRYSLTVWTSHSDQLILQNLLPYRKQFEMSRIYYDLPEPLRTELSET